jgi:hypothetical protein
MSRLTSNDFVNANKFLDMETESPLVELQQALTKEALEYFEFIGEYFNSLESDYVEFEYEEEYEKVIKDVSEIWEKNSNK